MGWSGGGIWDLMLRTNRQDWELGEFQKLMELLSGKSGLTLVMTHGDGH